MRRPTLFCLRALAMLAILLALYMLGSLAYVRLHERKDPADAAPPAGRFIDVDGVPVFSQRHPAHGDGMPVLLVHGTAAWSGTWFSLIPALQRAGHPVIAVDLPPFGYSGKSIATDFSRTAQARRLRAVLDAYAIPRAIVVGHSFGGGPALELALQSPDRVERLVLVDAALGLQAAPPDPTTAPCRLLANPVARDAIIAATAGNPLWSAALLRRFVARKQAVTNERLREYRRPTALRGAAAALAAWSYHFACVPERGLSISPAQVAGLRPAAFLLWGAQDSITPLPQALYLRSLLPRAPLAIIAGAGHIPHIEQPATFERALLEVLDTPVASPSVQAPRPTR